MGKSNALFPFHLNFDRSQKSKRSLIVTLKNLIESDFSIDSLFRVCVFCLQVKPFNFAVVIVWLEYYFIFPNDWLVAEN